MTTQDDDALAADYVMGLLDEAARQAADARLARDAAFARQVGAWRDRLHELDAGAEPVAPSPGLWPRIAASIATPPAPTARHGRETNWLWDSLRFWRGFGLAAGCAAALLVVMALELRQSARQAETDLAALTQRKPVYVAVLVNEATRETGAIVNAFANGRVELIPLRPIDVPPGRALQVWTLWDRAVGPKSVGLTAQSRSLQLDLGALPPTVPDQLFEITLEPEGGSPLGRPTGPILFKGNAARAL
jgi:anti-sigma-K factor RskA